MDITLLLKKHCIETEAKKMYERLIKQYFKKNGLEEEKKQIESTLESLKFFLEHADFPKIRSAYPELSGTTGLSVTLRIPRKAHDARIIINNQAVPPIWR